MNSPTEIMRQCTDKQKQQLTVLQRWIVQSLFILAQSVSANFKKRQELKTKLHLLERRIDVLESKMRDIFPDLN